MWLTVACMHVLKNGLQMICSLTGLCLFFMSCLVILMWRANVLLSNNINKPRNDNKASLICFVAGLDEKSVPALQHLEVRPCHFLEHLEHSKLEILKIESNHSDDQHPTILLGKLPALKRFHLSLRIEKLKVGFFIKLSLSQFKVPSCRPIESNSLLR